MSGPRGNTGRRNPDTTGKCLACSKPAPKHSYCHGCRERLAKGWLNLEFTEEATPTRQEMRRAKSAGTAVAWAPFLPWETQR